MLGIAVRKVSPYTCEHAPEVRTRSCQYDSVGAELRGAYVNYDVAQLFLSPQFFKDAEGERFDVLGRVNLPISGRRVSDVPICLGAALRAVYSAC